MDISNWTVDDFVLDPDFRDWVSTHDLNLNLIWEQRIKDYPHKIREIKLARDLVLNLPKASYSMSDQDLRALWERIDETTDAIPNPDAPEVAKIFPLNSQSTIKRMDRVPVRETMLRQRHKVALILAMAFLIGFLVSSHFGEVNLVEETPLVFTEHVTPLGVKSTIILPDSSKAILNAGSKLAYQENFSGVAREVFLEGEGYFEVTSDPNRPFVVNAGATSTKAIGTSFNINAYNKEKIGIYLVTGKVKVLNKELNDSEALLSEGESVALISGKLSEKKRFIKEKVTAWTKGVLFFDDTPILDAVRVMENWYNVKISLTNSPPANLRVSGKFENETLKNILTGLSFSSRFQFELKGNVVNLTFIK
ncbi:FecR family protein [Lunatimonas salinarum]|uniref:FecR family protein n=1 Tax=Lunatimonas salinarum TaxID=1774590 RepID=UPI001ADF90EA|nr:FecR domain-containing protein [Lunatimonas salinarum]